VFVLSACGWAHASLFARVAQALNSKEKYAALQHDWTVKLHLRWQPSMQLTERKFIEAAVESCRSLLLPFPYQYLDSALNLLGTTPFQYYRAMLLSLIKEERSFDTIPNFTARDSVRLLGIGRESYIDCVNRTKAAAKGNSVMNLFKGRSERAKEILPKKTVDTRISPWSVRLRPCLMCSAAVSLAHAVLHAPPAQVAHLCAPALRQ
jgi:hypothetical protein